MQQYVNRLTLGQMPLGPEGPTPQLANEERRTVPTIDPRELQRRREQMMRAEALVRAGTLPPDVAAQTREAFVRYGRGETQVPAVILGQQLLSAAAPGAGIPWLPIIIGAGLLFFLSR